MTARIYPYLTFENAKEAMDYYVEAFGAEIISHTPLSEAQAQSLGLPVDDLSSTTALGEIAVAGQKLLCADATMMTPQPSSLVSIMLSFEGDEAQARAFFDHLASNDDLRVTIPFGPHPFSGQLGQVVDRYGITWYVASDEG